MFRFVILLFIGCASHFVIAQDDMSPGFKLLEKGDFEKAESFFESYLQSDPENKTANLCYGRAVGLSGDPKRATVLFGSLKDQYPNDYEITINYNESFLWDKQYNKAKPLYQDLVEKYPDKFGAVLGYANTLSNLKEYKRIFKTHREKKQSLLTNCKIVM